MKVQSYFLDLTSKIHKGIHKYYLGSHKKSTEKLGNELKRYEVILDGLNKQGSKLSESNKVYLEQIDLARKLTNKTLEDRKKGSTLLNKLGVFA